MTKHKQGKGIAKEWEERAKKYSSLNKLSNITYLNLE